jgi:hypothetical protein
MNLNALDGALEVIACSAAKALNDLRFNRGFSN